MKAVRYITRTMHYVFLAAAVLCAMALISLSGSSVRSVIAADCAAAYARLLFIFGGAFAVSLILFGLDSLAERFAAARI